MASFSTIFQNDEPTPAGFVFVGDHPAIDFANTLVLADGQPLDNLRAWEDVVNWLAEAGLSTDARLLVPRARGASAVKNVVELRQGWRTELHQLVAGRNVSDTFIEQLNGLLAVDVFHERLERGEETGFHLHRSDSPLNGEKLALALIARQIAHFLAEANFEYLHRCANTASCVLFFYDTTKNHRRQWCSVATCGNRHKVAEFRKRQIEAKA